MTASDRGQDQTSEFLQGSARDSEFPEGSASGPPVTLQPMVRPRPWYFGRLWIALAAVIALSLATGTTIALRSYFRPRGDATCVAGNSCVASDTSKAETAT